MHTGLPDWWSLFILHLQNIIHQLRGSQLNASSTSGWQCVAGGINKNSTWPSVDVLLCVLFFFSPPIKPIYLCVHVFIYIHCKIGKIGDIPHTQSHTHITHIYNIYIYALYIYVAIKTQAGPFQAPPHKHTMHLTEKLLKPTPEPQESLIIAATGCWWTVEAMMRLEHSTRSWVSA